ncbi:Ankyrin-1 [Glycine soja]|nr:Ankyrin-1 [Glycine max]
MSDSGAVTLPAVDDIPKHENCSELGIVVAEAEHLQSLEPESSFLELDRTHKRQIYIAASSGNWSEALSYFKIHPHWWRIPLTSRGVTALHVAVSMRKTSFVEKLVDRVDRMNMQDLEIRMADGNTAFCLAAITGNVKCAKILLGKNPGLLWIRDHKDMLPIQLSSSAGHIPMTELLFEAQDDLHNNIPFHDIVNLFFLTITNNIHTLVRRDIVSSLFKGMEEEKEPLNSEQLSKVVFDAAKSGNIMILECLLKYHPDLLFEVDSREQRSLLHIAILYRQESVYQLILSKGDSKNVMIQLVDSKGNNVLHLAAGELAPEERFGLPNHVLMAREENWFQEVEKIVPPAMKTMKNERGFTPKEVFYQLHNELHKESVSAVKDAANTLIVVATLVITLGITGALSIPIKDVDSTLTPIFRKKTWYTLYFLAIEVGNYLCAASMMFYGSVIIPSSWEPKYEGVLLRQRKLMFGNMALSASLGLMFTAIVSGAILIYDFLSDWLFYFIAGLGCITLISPKLIRNIYEAYHPLVKKKKA